MSTTKQTYSFKKGDRFSLDDIYEIQSLAGGDWWEKTGNDLPEYMKKDDFDMSEDLICTRSIKITIAITNPPSTEKG